MNKILNIKFLLLFLTFSLGLNAQITLVPDPVFENYLETHDENGLMVAVGSPTAMGDGIDGNGQVLTLNINGVTNLALNNLAISDFTGLEDFTSLEDFLQINNLSTESYEIDFSANTALIEISIVDAPFLSSVDVSQNILLDRLQIATQGDLFTEIDVSNNLNLTELSVYDNALTNLDTQNNLLLDFLIVRSNPITSLEVSHLSALETLVTFDTQITTLNLSSNSNLSLLLAENGALESLNLQNGANNLITYMDIRGNSQNGVCVLVDDVSYAQAQTNWFKDDNSEYRESYFQDIEVEYDGFGNQAEINDWLSGSDACWNYVWNYNIIDEVFSDSDFDFAIDRLEVTVEFSTTDTLGELIITNAKIIFNDFAVAGPTAGIGDTICDNTFPISEFDNLEPGEVDYSSNRYSSSTFEIGEIFNGPSGVELEGSDVKFPETGSGQFTYEFEFKVTTSILIGTEQRSYTTNTNYTANDVIVAFNPVNPNTTIVVCDFNNLDLLWLYDQLDIDIEEAIDQSEFNLAFENGNVFDPANFWYNENDDLGIEIEPDNLPDNLTSISSPGTYQFNARRFLEKCAGEPIYVTLVQGNTETYAIPDQQFEQALIDQNIDSDQTLNGQIQTCDISNIENLNIENYAISNFDGLQYFTGLKSFYLANNSTTFFHTIDFSGNLQLENIIIESSTRLSGINVIENIELNNVRINTFFGAFDSIDFSQNINLVNLDLSFNIGLANLQFSLNPSLESLNLSNTSAFNVDLTNFPNLERLFMSEISSLSSIDVSGNDQLWHLAVDNTSIEELDVSNLSQLYILNVNYTDIEYLDVSNNTLLASLGLTNNPELKIANLKNDANTSMITYLIENPNLSCVLVDDVSFSQNSSFWYEDDIAIYTDNSICSSDAIDETVFFDGIGNEDDVIEWVNKNGNSVVYSPEDLTWSYTFNTIIQTDNLIEYNTTFNGVGSSVNFSTDAIFTINTANFDAGDDFAPAEGDVANGVEAEGSLCDYESYDLNLFKDTSGFDSGVYENSTIGYVQRLDIGTGPPVTNIDGTEVQFPETGSGQFSYYYTFNISKEVQFFGMTESITISDEASVWHWLTIPFDPGEDKAFTACTSDNITLDDLYAQFEIVDGTDDVSFNPNDYWFDINGNPITSYSGPGEYVFNAGGFLPECGAKPASVVVTEQESLSAGLDGELGICPGDTPTDEQLFMALQGSADEGGTWQEISAGVYQYSHAATSCNPESTAIVTLTEEIPLSAGLDGNLGICPGDTPTDEQLFMALQGSADEGGAWQEISTGVYQYSHAATSCNPESTAIVTLTEEIPLSAGLDGELGICPGEIPTDEELFEELQGSPDEGGIWQEISTGVYQYSHEATSCHPESTAIVTLVAEVPLSAGMDGELGICPGDIPTEAELFEALGSDADIGGTWLIISTGVYQYTHAATSCNPESSAIVTLTEEVPLSAGLDGDLGICPGDIPTDEQLFMALEGNPDEGGTWQEISTGVYQYSHEATSCTPESTAIVTLTDEVPLSAGLDGDLGICPGDIPTDEQLFMALEGSADEGGTWQEISTGVYQYSHAATSCNPESTALVTLIEEVPLSAGLDGDLDICSGDTPTDEQLYMALQGSPDEGGAWQEISTGVYQYTHAATSCHPESTAIVSLVEELPLSAGLDGQLGICSDEIPTEAELFEALEGSADEGGTWQEIATGVYQYSHTATSCHPESTAIITLTEEIPLSAGLDGELGICAGDIPTGDQLFEALQGSADEGGTWQEISAGVYQYSHAATSCNPEVTALVTLIEEVQLSAGLDGELGICPGDIPTNEQLFEALLGSADVGGIWQEISTGVYQYSHAATSCNPEVTALVTLTEEVPLSAGLDGELGVCSDEIPTEAELFEALEGNADIGGIWEEISTGVYQYSHAATNCSPGSTATVTLTEEVELSAGSDGELEVCPGSNPTFNELFDALGGNPNIGGTWVLIQPGVFQYTHFANSCYPQVSAIVTLIEEVPLSAGESTIITKCESEVPTEEELFNALGGNPDEGGTWQEIEPNIFEYSHSGSQCFSSITATVSIDVIEVLSAGEDAEIDIEEGTLLTESILFDALGGDPDQGGVWSPEPLAGGTYTYTHTNGDCPDTSSTVEVREVDLIPNNLQLDGLNIYPNPSIGIIRLSNEDNIRIYSIEIYAVTGQKVVEIKSDFNLMNISELEAAMYFVQINSAAGIKMVKLVLK